jgi:hypothetical protein
MSDQRTQIITELKSYGYDQENIERFLAYHELHKWAWKAFESAALKLIDSGKTRIGAKAIAEQLRANQPEPKYGTFKFNNNYTAMYARVFVIKHPRFRDRFEFREISGLKPMTQTSLEFKEGRAA